MVDTGLSNKIMTIRDAELNQELHNAYYSGIVANLAII